jgi:hypothetical protein
VAEIIKANGLLKDSKQKKPKGNAQMKRKIMYFGITKCKSPSSPEKYTVVSNDGVWHINVSRYSAERLIAIMEKMKIKEKRATPQGDRWLYWWF